MQLGSIPLISMIFFLIQKIQCVYELYSDPDHIIPLADFVQVEVKKTVFRSQLHYVQNRK